MVNFFYHLTMVLFLIVCVFMVLLVLIQKGRGGGLASAFGGAGGNTAFGSKTGDVLTWATSIVFGIFLVLAVALNLLATARHNANVGLPPLATAGTPAAQNSSLPARGEQSSLPDAPPPPPALTDTTAGAPSDNRRPMSGEVEPAPGAAPQSATPTTAPATQPGN